MKKIIGILAAGTLVLLAFMNTNEITESSSNLDLDNLISLNSADAECPTGIVGVCRMTTAGTDDCMVVSWWHSKDCH